MPRRAPEFRCHDFCYWLFATLYKDYDAEPEKYRASLPHHTDYEVPENRFYKRIGDCQIEWNNMFRPYCKELFNKVHKDVCVYEQRFLYFAETACEQLSINLQPNIMIIAFCAIISELNLYCFKHGCYRYADYAPRCLYTVMTNSPYLSEFILQGPDARKGYAALRNFCREISRGEKKISDYEGICLTFIAQERKRIKFESELLKKNTLAYPCSPIMSEDEEEPVEESTAGSSRPSIGEASGRTSMESIFQHSIGGESKRPSLDATSNLTDAISQRSAVGEGKRPSCDSLCNFSDANALRSTAGGESKRPSLDSTSNLSVSISQRSAVGESKRPSLDFSCNFSDANSMRSTAGGESKRPSLDSTSKFSSSEASMERDSPLSPEESAWACPVKSLKSTACKICREDDCTIYLQIFIDKFREVYSN